MTNEQLALYLKQIAARVRQLAMDIEPLITGGERLDRLVWVGEGEPPLIPMPWKEGWEIQPIGIFKAVDIVDDFALTLEMDAQILLDGKEKEEA